MKIRERLDLFRATVIALLVIFAFVPDADAITGDCFDRSMIQAFTKDKNPEEFQFQLQEVELALEHSSGREVVSALISRGFSLELEAGVVLQVGDGRTGLIPLAGKDSESVFGNLYEAGEGSVSKKFMALSRENYQTLLLLEFEIEPAHGRITRLSVGSPFGHVKSMFPHEGVTESRRFEPLGKKEYEQADWDCTWCVVKECLWGEDWCSWAMTLVVNCWDCWTGVGCVDCFIGIAQAITCSLIDCDQCDEDCAELLPPASWVLVPEGEFWMGCEGDPDCGSDEDPEHPVYLDEFYIGKYEVTNQEYRDAIQWAYDNGYVSATSSSAKDVESGVELLDLDDPDCEIFFAAGVFGVDFGKEEHPVIEVSWYGAACFCDWQSIQESIPAQYDHSDWTCSFNGSGYRLPTEAEWEKASRGIDFRKYPWGNDEPDCNYLNFIHETHCVGWTTPVGSYTPLGDSPYDACDMSGNVWEWCNDWYDSEYYGISPYENPRGPGGGSNRVDRGGSWVSSAGSCRSASRDGSTPGNTGSSLGFRLVRSAF